MIILNKFFKFVFVCGLVVVSVGIILVMVKGDFYCGMNL